MDDPKPEPTPEEKADWERRRLESLRAIRDEDTPPDDPFDGPLVDED